MKPGAEHELLESRQVFDGKVLGLRVDRVRLANGRVSELEVVRHPGAVAIAAITAEGDLLLVRQYRYATGELLLEVPAGKLDPGEDPQAAALRELEEETGFGARAVESLGWVWTTPGFSDEKIWFYLARDLTPSQQALEDDEVLTVERLALREAVEQALDGRLFDSKSVACVLRAARRLGAIWPIPTSPDRDRD